MRRRCVDRQHQRQVVQRVDDDVGAEGVGGDQRVAATHGDGAHPGGARRRDVGAAVAVQTSFRAVIANPLVMAVWGIIVAALLVLGSLPLLVGLAVVVPVLGHATWHLYRKVVTPLEP